MSSSPAQRLSRKEVMKILHVSYSTLCRWNKSGYLTSLKKGPSRVEKIFYKEEKIRNFIAEKQEY